jgi:hypothetical protein
MAQITSKSIQQVFFDPRSPAGSLKSKDFQKSKSAAVHQLALRNVRKLQHFESA